MCDQNEVTGCLDSTACNYDATATDAGYCDYAQTNYDCDSACLNDTDADGICDEFEVAGCTTPSACNFDASARKTMAVASLRIQVTIAPATSMVMVFAT